jgi:hypothetical protein
LKEAEDPRVHSKTKTSSKHASANKQVTKSENRYGTSAIKGHTSHDGQPSTSKKTQDNSFNNSNEVW